MQGRHTLATSFESGGNRGPGEPKRVAEEARRGVPLPGGAAAPTTHGRQRHRGLPPEARRRVRHVRRGRVGRVRALLLPGPHGRGGLSVALRAEERAAQARGLTSDDPFREETDDPLVAAGKPAAAKHGGSEVPARRRSPNKWFYT